MTQASYSGLNDSALIAEANNKRIGNARALAIEELASRALMKPELLPSACAAIASDRRIGFHAGMPLGWLGADKLFLSSQEHGIKFLLQEMNTWQPTEQEDLVRDWAGKGRLAALTRELGQCYGWSPRYKIPV